MQSVYKYQIPAWRNIGCFIIYSFGSMGLGYLSFTNQRSLRIHRIITFSPETSSAIYLLSALVLLAGVVMSVVLIKRSFNGPIDLIFNETDVVLPKASLYSELISIPYSSIEKVLVNDMQRQQMITVNSSMGQARVLSIGFKNPGEFLRFKQALASRLNG